VSCIPPIVSRRLLLAAGFLLFGGCATVPVGVKRLDPTAVQRHLTANVLTVDKPSLPTRNLLYQRNLAEPFEENPEEVLQKLHEYAIANNDDATYFALAELAFHHADQSGDHTWHLAAALYAWAFLFDGKPVDSFDPRLRVATDLYNRALTQGLSPSAEGKAPDKGSSPAAGDEVEIRAGEFRLPWGKMNVAFDPQSLDWNGRHLQHFLPVAEMEVIGLQSRFRRPGIGAPARGECLG
jgi:hypothetical protein